MTIPLSPVTSGDGVQFPIVSTIARPAEIIHDTDATVEISPDLTYTAPSPVGSYTPAIDVRNSQGNSVTSTFVTTVVYDTADTPPPYRATWVRSHGVRSA